MLRMIRQPLKDLETVAHNARLQFVRHELKRGLAMARLAQAAQESGNRSGYEECKGKADKTHRDFESYLTSIRSTLSTDEDEELAADLLALRNALHDLNKGSEE